MIPRLSQRLRGSVQGARSGLGWVTRVLPIFPGRQRALGGPGPRLLCVPSPTTQNHRAWHTEVPSSGNRRGQFSDMSSLMNRPTMNRAQNAKVDKALGPWQGEHGATQASTHPESCSAWARLGSRQSVCSGNLENAP